MCLLLCWETIKKSYCLVAVIPILSSLTIIDIYYCQCFTYLKHWGCDLLREEEKFWGFGTCLCRDSLSLAKINLVLLVLRHGFRRDQSVFCAAALCWVNSISQEDWRKKILYWIVQKKTALEMHINFLMFHWQIFLLPS